MENKEIEINKTPLTLQQWSDSNHLYLSDELLDNVDKWLREISTHNYEKNAKESWEEYLSDHEEDFPTQRTLEEMLEKRGRAEVILDKIKHTGDINEINELTKELDELNKKNAEKSWREYMDEDKVLYVTPTKQK